MTVIAQSMVPCPKDYPETWVMDLNAEATAQKPPT